MKGRAAVFAILRRHASNKAEGSTCRPQLGPLRGPCDIGILDQHLGAVVTVAWTKVDADGCLGAGLAVPSTAAVQGDNQLGLVVPQCRVTAEAGSLFLVDPAVHSEFRVPPIAVEDCGHDRG